jgi:hypothetical protein
MSDVQTKVQTALEMTFNTDLEPTGKKGKCLTILSIDGGGVRGIIPAKILEVLEDEIRVNFFGAHPAQKCRFFTHPAHPKKLAIPVCCVRSDLQDSHPCDIDPTSQSSI